MLTSAALLLVTNCTCTSRMCSGWKHMLPIWITCVE